MHKLRSLFRRFREEKQGAALIEMGLIGPVVAAMFLAMVDVSLWMVAKMSVDRAARAGAEYAQAHSDANFNAQRISSAVGSATTARSYMSAVSASPAPTQWYGCPNITSGVATATSSAAVCSTGMTAGTYVTVNAQSTFTFPVPWGGHNNANTIAAAATVRIN
jgi:Flp pilus assembly protein TadG